jgi:hypothetical protein
MGGRDRGLARRREPRHPPLAGAVVRPGYRRGIYAVCLVIAYSIATS